MIQFENFIRAYDDAFSAEYCSKLIEYVDAMEQAGFGHLRESPKHIKDDVAVHLSEDTHVKLSTSIKFSEEFFKVFPQIFDQYKAEFSVLDGVNYSVFDIKAQKTKIGGGYHAWHHERGDKQYASRILAYTVYLNDVQEGGETEFLYYPIRIKPKMGTVLLFPAGFTHTHRGNPPISNEKYIITGWVEF